MLKVLQVVDTLGMGGAETWLVALQEHWAKTGRVQMDYLLTSGNPGLFDQKVAGLGAKLFYCTYQRKKLGSFAKQFRQLLLTEKYSAIHDHQDYASGWHFLMGLGRLPKVAISHVHNPTNHITVNYAISPLRWFTAQFGKFLVRRLATMICGTSAEILKGYGFDPNTSSRPPVAVAHCGFKVNRFNAPRESDRQEALNEFGWNQYTKLVLFAGRLDRRLEFDHPQNHKNSWFAINVAKLATERDQQVCLVMAGAGDEMRRKLEKIVSDWGLSSRFKLVGVRHDLPRLMRAADCLLFPSREEGLGMVAVEAQAAGLPVLASTGVPQECVVIPDLCRFLSLDQSLDDWATALLAMASAPRRSMVACRDALQASDFSIENSAARLECIYSGMRR